MSNSYYEAEAYTQRTLFDGEENSLNAIDVFAVACMSACGTEAIDISSTFQINQDEVDLFVSPQVSMLGDSWAEHIVTTYMDACVKEEDEEKALNRFNNSVKIILHWYDCCATMLGLYKGLEPGQTLPDLASFSHTLLICSESGIVGHLLSEDVAVQVTEAAEKFQVAKEYLEYLIGTGRQDDTAVNGQLKAVFSMGVV